MYTSATKPQLIAPVLVLLAAGCGTTRGGDEHPFPRFTIEAIGDPSSLPQPGAIEFRTGQDRYALTDTAQGVQVEIAFTYANRTGTTVYVRNCNQSAPPGLEKQVDGEWVLAWVPVVNACLSPPIEIPDGFRYSATLGVVGGGPGSNINPQFSVDDLGGMYRLSWWALYGSSAELPQPLKVSSEFALDGPR